jgi:uncharacterized repeat protein (TIGR01451 family)
MFMSRTLKHNSSANHSSKKTAGIRRFKWPHLAGLFIIQLAFMSLFGLLFAQATPAHALSGRSDATIGKKEPARLAPPQQGDDTTLDVIILSSPYATLDSNDPTGSGSNVPQVFVIEAAVTNTGLYTATEVVVTLDYQEDVPNGWVLLPGEEPTRTIDELAPGQVHHSYWFARYPAEPTGASHQYTVTAEASNAGQVATSTNSYGDPAPDKTVQTRKALSAGNSGLVQSSAEIVVGVAFTVTEVYDLGSNPDDVIFGPVGNTDFDPSAYRLLASEVTFYNAAETPLETFADRVYIPPSQLPTNTATAQVTYTFIALRPTNTQVCSYTDIGSGNTRKYDNSFCQASTTVPVEGTLSLSLDKQVSSVTTQQGQSLTYSIHYTNTGDMPIQYAWIWDDVLTDALSILPLSIDPPSDPGETNEGRVAWNLDSIPQAGETGSSGTLTFNVLVDGNGQDVTDGMRLVNHAYFGINSGSLPHSPALTSSVTTTVQSPMIAISKTDGHNMVEPGGLLTYTLRVTNSGSLPAAALVLTDTLPSGVTPVVGSITPSPDTQLGQTLVWNTLGSIPANGGQLLVTIPVTVAMDVPDEALLTNSASVKYENTAGHTYTPNTASDSTTVRAPVLAFTKGAEDLSGPPLAVGDTVRYTLLVTNTGGYTAYDVVVTDDLPDQVTCQDTSGDGAPACADPLIWDIPSLAPDATATLYVEVTINPGSEGQTIVNTGSVTGGNVPVPPDNPQPVCPDGSTPIEGVCPTTPQPVDTQLAFAKTAEDLNGSPLAVGDTVRYTLLVTNTGGYTAYDVVVTDDLPDQVTCQDTSGDGAPACADPLIWDIPSLAPDATATLYVEVTINPGSEGQTIVNTGSVTGGNVPVPPDNPEPVCPDGSTPIEGVCPTIPGPATTISFAKTAEDLNGSPLAVGDTVRYTLLVTNIGSYTAYNLVVTDDLPDQVTCHETSGDGAPACADPLIWNIPSLAPDATATLYVEVTINPGSEGQTIVNTGSVTGGNVPVPPDNPEPVCPDGSTPVGGICLSTPEGPEEDDLRIFLPIILRMVR